MASQLNSVIMVGRLTRDPELRTTKGGTSVADFGLANSRTWKDKEGETQKKTTFVNVTAWGALAELVDKILNKGDLVVINGTLELNQWESKEGEKRSKVFVQLNNFQTMVKKSGKTVGAGVGADDDEESGRPF